MKPFLVLLFTSMLFVQCSIDRTVLALDKTELETLQEFKDFDAENQVQISNESEIGQKLWLCLTLVSKENNRPLIDQKVDLYHTSSNGEYEPSNPSDESTARLRGSAFTNEKGQLFVQTILPGDYGSSADNRHIHTTIENAQPEAYDIHFKQYTGQMGNSFISGSDQHFLADLKQTKDSTLVTFLTIEVKNPSTKPNLAIKEIPDCEWCGANEAPENTNWETTIAGKDVKGERLVLEGTVYQTDGTTPAKDVIIYAYHTNNNGLYEKKGDEKGNGVRHGYLRGWTKTNSDGKYRFHTIKPAPYPNRSEPAHIHMTLMGENFNEYWINSTWFANDKIITDEMVSKLDRTGGFSNIIELTKDDKGNWIGQRNIIINPPKE